MRSFRVVVPLALVVMLGLLGGAQPASATAAGVRGSPVQPSSETASNAAYDIEAGDYYCTGGAQCVPGGGQASVCDDGGYVCPGLNLGTVGALGLADGSPSGTPAALSLGCEHFVGSGFQQAFVSVYSAAGAGTISCIAGGPHGMDLGNVGRDIPYFEGELEWPYMPA